MNNSKNWRNNKRGGEPQRRGNGKGGRNGSQSGNNQRRKDLKDRQFKKFVDTNHNNETNYWPQNVWNNDNNINNYFNDGTATGGGIYPWIRQTPIKPLIIPKHINFEQQYEKEFLVENSSNGKEISVQNGGELVNKPTIPQGSDRDESVPRSRNNSVPSANHAPEDNHESNLTDQTDLISNIKQERKVKLNLKQEQQSTSSSSSSESSSSEEENEPENKTIAIKSEVSRSSKPPSSPLNIKLKPKTNSMSSTPTKTTKNPVKKLKPTSKSPSSLASSIEEESSASPTPSKAETKEDNTKKSQVFTKEEKTKTKNKNSSEDDVVCIGNLERKIILEDESDKEAIEDEETVTEFESYKKTSEKCMICDKKDHTSFQCQMICKNCSAPYHGYRTCPQPANLNTMLQLFIEFCMQQIHNFNADKPMGRNLCDTIIKQTVNSPHSVSSNNKSNKLKRKANEHITNRKASKKHKMSATKKTKSKDDDSGNSNDDDTNSETSSDESEESSSDSSTESIVSLKKKRKSKNKNASKAALNLSSFSQNPVHLPMVLNGFPNLTVPLASAQDSTTSTNTLNTLLLTQMFQNAIGSLKK